MLNDKILFETDTGDEIHLIICKRERLCKSPSCVLEHSGMC